MVDNTILNDEEAKEFHSAFSQSATAYLALAALVHALCWMWRPFWPGVEGWVSFDSVTQALTFLS